MASSSSCLITSPYQTYAQQFPKIAEAVAKDEKVRADSLFPNNNEIDEAYQLIRNLESTDEQIKALKFVLTSTGIENAISRFSRLKFQHKDLASYDQVSSAFIRFLLNNNETKKAVYLYNQMDKNSPSYDKATRCFLEYLHDLLSHDPEDNPHQIEILVDHFARIENRELLELVCEHFLTDYDYKILNKERTRCLASGFTHGFPLIIESYMTLGETKKAFQCTTSEKVFLLTLLEKPKRFSEIPLKFFELLSKQDPKAAADEYYPRFQAFLETTRSTSDLSEVDLFIISRRITLIITQNLAKNKFFEDAKRFAENEIAKNKNVIQEYGLFEWEEKLHNAYQPLSSDVMDVPSNLTPRQRQALKTIRFMSNSKYPPNPLVQRMKKALEKEEKHNTKRK